MNKDLLIKDVFDLLNRQEIELQKRKEIGNELCSGILDFIERNFVIKSHFKGSEDWNVISSASKFAFFTSGAEYILYRIDMDRVIFKFGLHHNKHISIGIDVWNTNEAYMLYFIRELDRKLIRKQN